MLDASVTMPIVGLGAYRTMLEIRMLEERVLALSKDHIAGSRALVWRPGSHSDGRASGTARR